MRISLGALLLFFGLLLVSGAPARAEGNCPDGYYSIGAPEGQAGPQGCAPIPGYNAQGTSNRVQAAPPAYFPQQDFGVRWGTWGAVAVDTANGKIGAARLLTKTAAEHMAMGDCRQRGGVNCQIKITYSNACIALAEGDSVMLTGRTGNSLGSARQAAMNECGKSSANCHIPYSDCSIPQ